jgi:transcriptional antiterminator NusG
MNWYVIKTKNGSEKKIKKTIEQKLEQDGFTKYVGKLFVPTQKQITMRKGKKVIKEIALMSGYVFMEAELTGELKSWLKTVNGVASVIVDPVKESEINRLMDSKKSDNDQITSDFVKGEWVTVMSGPFKSFTGEIQIVNRDKGTVTVDIPIFGRKTPLEIVMSDVQKVI